MADDAAATEIQINVKGPSELKLQISITTDKTVKELKEAIAAKSDVEAARQRLIYSGRVLKDDDQLTTYKIQSGHTIHMVKGAAAANSSSSTPSSTTASAPRQPLPTMQTGQLPSDPLTQLNGHRAFGAMAGINPFADMGLNPNDPNMMQGMLNNPAFMQQMSAMMSNPEVIDQIIANSPQLAGNPEHARQMLNSPIMRGILSDPTQLQQLLQMSAAMQGGGSPFAFGGAGGAPSFPAPGVPGQTPSSTTTPASNATPGTGTNANAAPAFNPLLWGLGGAGAGQAGAGGAGGAAGANPWMMNPALMQQFLGGAGGGAPAAPADTRPPEERFQVQLGQLNEMGFWDAQQNIRALLATGGNVHAAIEYMLGGGGA